MVSVEPPFLEVSLEEKRGSLFALPTSDFGLGVEGWGISLGELARILRGRGASVWDCDKKALSSSDGLALRGEILVGVPLPLVAVNNSLCAEILFNSFEGLDERNSRGESEEEKEENSRPIISFPSFFRRLQLRLSESVCR